VLIFVTVEHLGGIIKVRYGGIKWKNLLMSVSLFVIGIEGVQGENA